MWRSRAAAMVSGVLLTDASIHVYWLTGATWPARDPHSLSLAVLNVDVPFTPPVLVPLVVSLVGAAACVWLSTRAVPGSWGRIAAAGTYAVAAGLLVRGAAGLVWSLGIGADRAMPFYWLNLVLYTPLCLALGTAALLLARGRARRAGPPGARRPAPSPRPVADFP